jgi:hypothetical protein
VPSSSFVEDILIKVKNKLKIKIFTYGQKNQLNKKSGMFFRNSNLKKRVAGSLLRTKSNTRTTTLIFLL